jgi:hypothetical protein
MKKAIYLMSLLMLTSMLTKSQSTSTGKSITITKLIAYEKDNRFYIDWATDGTVETNYWEVQISTDGKRFSTLALVLGADPSQPGEAYAYKGKVDEQKRAAYYRVVHISANGIKQQSKIIKLVKLESMSFINPEIKDKEPVEL